MRQNETLHTPNRKGNIVSYTTHTYTPADLRKALHDKWGGKLAIATVHLQFTSDLVGSQAGKKPHVEAFVEHHLKLDPKQPTGAAAVARILGEEVHLDTDEGELQERQSYGLEVLRRLDDDTAWVGTWQVRAMCKQAASRLGIFAERGKVGSKGDLSEALLVTPDGLSMGSGQYPDQQILILDAEGEPYRKRQYRRFEGSVQTPSGRKSIQHDCEIAPPGCQIHVGLEWPSNRVSAKDMAALWGLAQRIGLGSVKALEQGRFRVVQLTIQTADVDREAKKTPKGSKAQPAEPEPEAEAAG